MPQPIRVRAHAPDGNWGDFFDRLADGHGLVFRILSLAVTRC
jgi:hypothetical protein